MCKGLTIFTHRKEGISKFWRYHLALEGGVEPPTLPLTATKGRKTNFETTPKKLPNGKKRADFKSNICPRYHPTNLRRNNRYDTKPKAKVCAIAPCDQRITIKMNKYKYIDISINPTILDNMTPAQVQEAIFLYSEPTSG